LEQPTRASPSLDANASASLRKRAFTLEYLTIVWNLFEGVAAITASVIAGSVALLAFGLDSMVEIFASIIVVWELRGVAKNRERRALQLIGCAYLLVAAYVFWEAAQSLLAHHRAEDSPGGAALMVATIAVMLTLALAKWRTGKRLGSLTVMADARFSAVDAGLSATVLAGLLANAFFGWWWVDALLAIVLAGVAAKEGIESFTGRD
jgi:divalent metal cation (Fe/Co/Zn/Cd) transporter